MTEPVDPELCLAMAKLLPEKIAFVPKDTWYPHQSSEDAFKMPVDCFVWKENDKEILGTEWLTVMRMVEVSQLTGDFEECNCYIRAIGAEVAKQENMDPGSIFNWTFCASFNQRARAMKVVKGL